MKFITPVLLSPIDPDCQVKAVLTSFTNAIFGITSRIEALKYTVVEINVVSIGTISFHIGIRSYVVEFFFCELLCEKYAIRAMVTHGGICYICIKYIKNHMVCGKEEGTYL